MARYPVRRVQGADMTADVVESDAGAAADKLVWETPKIQSLDFDATEVRNERGGDNGRFVDCTKS